MNHLLVCQLDAVAVVVTAVITVAVGVPDVLLFDVNCVVVVVVVVRVNAYLRHGRRRGQCIDAFVVIVALVADIIYHFVSIRIRTAVARDTCVVC